MRLAALVFSFALVALPACGDDDNEGDGQGGVDGASDSAQGGDQGSGGDISGSLTGCDLNFNEINPAGKAYGVGCNEDAECRYGVCLKPGIPGNITNTQFGFCTRGCDCENATAAQIPVDQKEILDCLYPSGFVKMHHVVVECGSVSECTTLDARWTGCELPDTGGARNVCHAL